MSLFLCACLECFEKSQHQGFVLYCAPALFLLNHCKRTTVMMATDGRGDGDGDDGDDDS